MKRTEDFAHYAAALAQRAILYEVSTTPKPGLVDRHNRGAHRDMDFFTFMASSSSLYRGLYDCTSEGALFEGKDSSKLLDIIRKPGVECERAMFEATGGINTHKGIIFSMGIICAVAGKLFKSKGTDKFYIEEVLDEVMKVTDGLMAKDLSNIQEKKVLTHGERLYIEHGFRGIRGEVEGGFTTLQKGAIQTIRNWNEKRDLSMNDLFIETLFNIMVESEDTNVVIRGGIESLEYVKNQSRNFLEAGGIRQTDAIQKLERMNSDFIEKNISPGGSADLLAVGIFLGMLEGIIK